MKNILRVSLIASSLFMPMLSMAATELDMLKEQWAETNYQLKGEAQGKAFEALIETTNAHLENDPKAVDWLIWRGILESSYAGAKGGLGALSLAKKAKKDFEKAMEIDDKALQGSAYTSLGTLYFKVPGWPIGFGDDDKAKALLEKALAINPTGIDSNYFYGLYLADKHDLKQAELYLLRAQHAKPRALRPLADKGRQAEIADALEKVRVEMKNKAVNHADFIN